MSWCKNDYLYIMLEYNTQKEKLVLPEYGRNVQQMVDHCMTIEDREERNRCATAIVDIMRNLFSHQRDMEDFNKMLWNQLAIMSDFRLDIDYPCEVIRPENLHSRPKNIDYKLQPLRIRHYGKNIEQLIDIASSMPEGEEKLALSLMIAHHMKKLLYQNNPEGVDDEKVLKDLANFSHGQIVLDSATTHLRDYKDMFATPVAQRKKKKRK